jgi:hypothetical protein
MAKLEGKAGTITYGAASINWTKITEKVTRELGDTTDSTNYDAGSNMLWQAQLPVKLGLEYSIEGWFDTTLTPAAFVGTLFSASGPFNLLFTLVSGTIVGHGNFDLSDFELGAPIDNTVTFSATLKSNGVFIYGS